MKCFTVRAGITFGIEPLYRRGRTQLLRHHRERMWSGPIISVRFILRHGGK